MNGRGDLGDGPGHATVYLVAKGMNVTAIHLTFPALGLATIRGPAAQVLVDSTLPPIYYLVHLVKSRGRRTWHGAKSFFYDYIITPHGHVSHA
jgi:hypothetical protein